MSETIKLGGALDRDPMALLIFIFMAGVLLLVLATNNPLNPIYGTGSTCVTYNPDGSTTGNPASCFTQTVSVMFFGSAQTGNVGMWMIVLPSMGFVFLRIWMKEEGDITE